MKITKSQLKQVIKEEIVEALSFTMGGDPIAMPTKPDPEPEPEHVEGPERAKEIMIGISELLKAVGDLNQVTEEEAIAVLGAIIEYSIDGLKGGRPSGETTIKEDFSDLLSDLGSGLFGGGEEGGIEGLDLSTIDLTQLGAGIEDISGDIQSELDGIPGPLRQLVLKKILDTIELEEASEKTLKKVEKSTRKTAKKKFPKDKERQDAYVYGTKRKLGWKPKKERGKK